MESLKNLMDWWTERYGKPKFLQFIIKYRYKLGQ